MKAKQLLKTAIKEIEDEEGKKVLRLLKKQIRDIRACKKTLKRLEEYHKKTLEKDVTDLEVDGFVY
jgi:hypothetical protein